MRKFFLFLIALASIAFGVCSPALAWWQSVQQVGLRRVVHLMRAPRNIAALFAAALAFLPQTAFAQSSPIPGFPPGVFSNKAAFDPPAGGGGGSITWTPGISTAWQNISFGANATFHPNNNVAPPANSLYCAFVAIQRGTPGIGTFTVTIDGSTPTPVDSDTGGAGVASGNIILYCITKASFASDTVVISGASNLGWETAIGGYFQNFISSTATATGCQQGQLGANPITITTTCASNTPTTITVPASGIGITASFTLSGTAGTSCATFAWTTTSTSNITSASGDANACETTTPAQLDVAHTIMAGAWGPAISFTPTPSGFNSAIVAATFN